MEQKLREASFGYRAKYIASCTQQIKEKGELTWFSELQNMPYSEAHKELLSLSGIGPKVADCICLMSLNHLDAIPVDTHVFQIAKKHYLPDLKSTKTVTAKTYEEIGNTFRKIYGPYSGKTLSPFNLYQFLLKHFAGWAQTVLFCADLKQFHLPERNINVGDSMKNKKLKTK